MNEAELVFGLAALVYATGLALFRLPFLPLRRWGWTAMMHSWSTVAVFTLVGSIALIKPIVSSYLQQLGYNLPLAATFDDAIASAEASRDMAVEWLKAISLAAASLGMLQSIIMLALLPAWISGVGILLSAIASFLFGAVFSLLIFIAKILSGVVLFMEGVVAFVGFAKGAAPALFIIGLILFAIPFARTAGKTFLVLGAALTIALPVAIVAASPPPGYADRSIMEAADVQKLSIASKAVADMEGGVRYTVYDRENDTLWYPFLYAEFTQLPEVDRDKVCANLPRGGNLTCEQLVEIVRDILKTPQKLILDTGGGGYYNAYDEGYRTTLVNGTYGRRIWFLNMWVTLYDTSPRNMTVYKIPDMPVEEAEACTRSGRQNIPYVGPIVCDPYIIWKTRWEGFWRSTNLYNETSLWMVAVNRNTTFVYFTEQPWGTRKEDLNIYGITLPKVRELRWSVNETYTCETDGNSSTTETCWRWHYYTRGDYSGNKSVYFVYLNMDDWQACWHIGPIHGGPVNGTTVCEPRHGTPSWSYQFIPFTSNPPAWNHTVLDSSFAEIKSAGFIDDYGPYVLPQSVEAIDRNQPLELNAPTQEKKVFVTANQTIIRDSYDGYPEVPDSLSYRFRVIFSASESMPYLPAVEWEKFDRDREYTRELASGGYVPDNIAGLSIINHRSEWSRFQNFRQGLYRDGPSHEATRRINAKLLEYRDENWETNATVLNTDIPLAKAVSELFYRNARGAYAGSDIQISILPILLTEGGGVRVLKPLADLIGQSFAIGLAIGFLAVVIDSFQALVGGQSMMMKYLFTKVGNISHAAKFFASFTATVNRMSRVDALARWSQRRQENTLLKAAFQERKQNRERWQKIVEKRVEKSSFKRLSALKAGWMERRLDRMEELEKKLETGELQGMKRIAAGAEHMALAVVTRNHMLSTSLTAVRRDQQFAEKVRDAVAQRMVERGVDPLQAAEKADKLIRWAKQGRIVAVEPEKFAEGFANVLKIASPSERVMLVDSFARSNFGETALKAYFFMPAGIVSSWLGERLSASGHVGSGAFFSAIGGQLDGRIRAPAAYSIASETNPFAPEGVRVNVTPATTVPVRTGLLHPHHSAEPPVIKGHDFGGEPRDVADASSYVKNYGTPSEVKEFQERLGDYLWIVSDPYDPGFNLIKEDKLVITTEGPDKVPVTFEVSKQDLDDFINVLQNMGYRHFSASGRDHSVTVEDAQPDFGLWGEKTWGTAPPGWGEDAAGSGFGDAPPEWGRGSHDDRSSKPSDNMSDWFVEGGDAGWRRKSTDL